VLFDAASRGRYATDASIYQIDPGRVCRAARPRTTRGGARDRREAGVPVLPRGGGTSQCGQTVGAALVIDTPSTSTAGAHADRERARHDRAAGHGARPPQCQLKPHGLWFPVDVSTSAQATIGGMAGNNSCGSRSIAYGNMVHNVLGIDAWLADGSLVCRFGPAGRADRAANGSASVIVKSSAGCRDRAREATRSSALAQGAAPRRRLQPRHLPCCERPYTADGANLAHLLVGSEGTLAFDAALQAEAVAAAARTRCWAWCHFPTFYAAMDAAQHIVGLGPSAVELVDRTMIELARANPAFRRSIDRR
jgi:FAD/FMN-containing dehydrogenase